MASRTRNSVLYALRWDIAAIAILTFLVVTYDWLSQTRVRETPSELTAGSRPPDRTEGDILLLLPDTPSAEANHINELDCSYSWFNTLWQEYGSFATALTRDLSPEILAGRTLVIVPARVARDMPANGVRALESFVKRGGKLIVERPNEQWTSLASVFTTGKDRHARQITSVEGLELRGSIRDDLLTVPLTGLMTAAPDMEPYPDGPLLLEVDGQAGIVRQEIEKGEVFSFLYNHGCATLALQQGRPAAESMTFKGSSAAERSIHVEELSNRIPHADLLDRAILRRVTRDRPTPRFWYFPSTFSGAMIMTLDAPEDFASALSFADLAKKREGATTIYVAADRLDDTQAALARKTGAEIGLSWVRGVNRPFVTESVGIGGLRPVATELDLNAQFTRLNLTLPDSEPLRLGRVEESMMQPDWASTFRQLAAARVRMSSTLGPTKRDQWGYLFGTGFPFYPLDDRGLPLPMLESPFVMSGASLSRPRLESLLGRSEGGDFQVLVLSIPSDVMARAPSAGVLLAFKDAFDLARKHDHWVAQHGELLDFLSVRRRSVLTSQFSKEQRKLTISANVLGARSISIESGSIPSVAFPKTWDGEGVEVVELDGEPVDLRKLAQRGSEYVVEVGIGRHVLMVQYAEPKALKIDEEAANE